MTDEKREMVRTESGSPARTERHPKPLAPLYELSETEKGFTLTLEMPGVGKDTLEIHADRETLSVRGRRGEPSEGLTPIFQERPAAEYYREFLMNDTVDREKITASVRDGIVTVSIPKASHAQPHRIAIS